MLKTSPARLALRCACAALVLAPAALGQPPQKPLQVPIIQLIATPQRFDHKLVRTIGYLRFFVEHGIVIASGISPSQEESENGVGDGVAVQTTDQMAKDREKLDKMYVEIVGTVRIVHTANTPPLALLVNVRSCVPRSDPDHPIMTRPLQDRLPLHDRNPPVRIRKQPLGGAGGQPLPGCRLCSPAPQPGPWASPAACSSSPLRGRLIPQPAMTDNVTGASDSQPCDSAAYARAAAQFRRDSRIRSRRWP